MDFFDLVRTGTPQDVQVAISNGSDMNARNSYDTTPLMFSSLWEGGLKRVWTIGDAGIVHDTGAKFCSK